MNGDGEIIAQTDRHTHTIFMQIGKLTKAKKYIVAMIRIKTFEKLKNIHCHPAVHGH